jgi:hypothetical protein
MSEGLQTAVSLGVTDGQYGTEILGDAGMFRTLIRSIS